MIFNSFKKEVEPEVEFWSVVDELNHPDLDFLRPQKASKFLPNWWKGVVANLQPDNDKHKGTIKKCPVFPEFLTQGYIIPLWCDVKLYQDENGIEWKTPTEKFSMGYHQHDQYLEWLPKHEQEKWACVWKFICPWRMRTPKGYSVYQLQPFYHFHDWQILPGSIRTDYHHELHQQTLVPKTYDKKWLEIKRGTPLVWYIPYKRTKYTEKYSVLDAEHMRLNNASVMNVQSVFESGYQKRARMEDKKTKE